LPIVINNEQEWGVLIPVGGTALSLGLVALGMRMMSKGPLPALDRTPRTAKVMFNVDDAEGGQDITVRYLGADGEEHDATSPTSSTTTGKIASSQERPGRSTRSATRHWRPRSCSSPSSTKTSGEKDTTSAAFGSAVRAGQSHAAQAHHSSAKGANGHSSTEHHGRARGVIPAFDTGQA